MILLRLIMKASSSRTFAQCSVEDISRLEKREFSKNTQYTMATVEKLFMTFLATKKIDAIPKDKEQLDGILKEFWPSLQTMKKEPYRASSMMTIRQILRTVIHDKIAVDILLDPELCQHNNVFKNFLLTLKKRGYGCINHHKEVTKSDLKLIMDTLDPQQPQQLQWLAWVNLQLHLCRRGFENSPDLKKSDLQIEKCGEVDIILLKKMK